jgi:hypothetical protein
MPPRRRKGWDCKRCKQPQVPPFIPPDLSKRRQKELRAALPRILSFLLFSFMRH